MSAPVNPVNLPEYEGMSDDERRDALLGWAREVEQAAKDRETDGRFAVIGLPEGVDPMAALLYSRCCTDLSDEEATQRMNLVPSGTRHGWVLVTEGEATRSASCDEKPGFRHLLFEC